MAFIQNLRNCTANYVLCFLNKKQISTLTLEMYSVLHFCNSVGLIITREIPCMYALNYDLNEIEMEALLIQT
jgi:hypothetical protein